ncbi:hypothetical protein SDC9_152584 [bioreactor metagenome]|uniref:Uncharacterized protein n=1 Tax=bioreactor metagenome TaxID=1076179 RepID=A0A645EY41_9ZZZZ
MLPVVAHIVTTERKHGHRIAAHNADGTGGGRRCFGCHGRAYEHAVVPVSCLIYQRGGLGPPSAEDDGRQGNPLGLLKLGGYAGAVDGRRGKAGVRMSPFDTRGGIPRLALPV